MGTIAENLVRDGLAEVTEALGFLGIKRSKLYELMQNGEIPYCSIGRRRLIPKRALVEFAVHHLRGGQVA